MDSRESLLQAGGPFDIVLADPPWRFASNSKDRPGKNPMAHYECMALDEIRALPVREIVAKDALLLLWVTVPFAQQAWSVMEAWGFRYVSQMVWPKQRIGTGFWVRNRHEIVYVARRGKFPCPRPAPFPDSVISGPQREHSRKPDALHEMTDKAFPDARKLEMFARESRPGWTTWGHERTKFDTSRMAEIDAFLGI